MINLDDDNIFQKYLVLSNYQLSRSNIQIDSRMYRGMC
jgi:hypothetical protein